MLKVPRALHRNTSQSWGASPAIWNHPVLPATQTCPISAQAMQNGKEEWKAELTWVAGYTPRWYKPPHIQVLNPRPPKTPCHSATNPTQRRQDKRNRP